MTIIDENTILEEMSIEELEKLSEDHWRAQKKLDVIIAYKKMKEGEKNCKLS